MFEKCFAILERIWYPFEWLGVSVKNNIVIHSNSLGYLFGKNCRLFEQLGLSVPKKSVIRTAWDIRFKKLLSVRTARAIRLKKKLSTVGGTEPICSKINFIRVSIPKPFHL